MYITGAIFKVSMFANNEQKTVEFNSVCTKNLINRAVYFYNTQNNYFSCIVCKDEKQANILIQEALQRVFNENKPIVKIPIVIPIDCTASYRLFGGDYERIFTSIH